MIDPSQWSPEHDPPRDPELARLLRSAEPTAGGTGVDWERLRAEIIRKTAGGGHVPGVPEWWDVVVRWRGLAAAASLAAMIGAGALLWQTGAGSIELAPEDGAAPESVAMARVVAAYPDTAVFASLVQDARTDQFTSWEER